MSDTTKEHTSELDPMLVEAAKRGMRRHGGALFAARNPGGGRKKGTPKTGGRTKGTPNVLTPAFREWLNDRARPFEYMAGVAAGEKVIEDGGKLRKPTPAERMRAVEALMRKIVPDLCATTLTSGDGGPVAICPAVSASTMSDFELARQLAFLLAKGIHDAEEGAMQPVGVAHSPTPYLPLQSHPKAAEEPVREDKRAGALTGSFTGDLRSPDCGLARFR